MPDELQSCTLNPLFLLGSLVDLLVLPSAGWQEPTTCLGLPALPAELHTTDSISCGIPRLSLLLLSFAILGRLHHVCFLQV